MSESLRLIKPERIRLQGHAEFNEAWLKREIVNDPKMLGLGSNLYVVGEEVQQLQGGRLDLILKDRDDGTRYEVELMLGETDPSHIIRCIEYWDLERKRYPKVEHVAVLVAETVNSRFLNVIGLFNSVIPIVAIQLSAFKIGDGIVLDFAKVLHLVDRGEEDEERTEVSLVTRQDWESWSSGPTLQLMDEFFTVLREISPNALPSYKNSYVGVMFGNVVDNIVTFKPRKAELRVQVYRLRDVQAWQQKLAADGIAVLDKYDDKVVFVANTSLFKSKRSLIKEMLTEAHEGRFFRPR